MPIMSSIGIVMEDSYRTVSQQHSQWEILYFIKGDGIVCVDNVEYPFTSGNFITIPPKTYHHTVSNEGYRVIYLLLSDFNKRGTSFFSDRKDRVIFYLLTKAHSEYHLKRNNWINIADAFISVVCEYMVSWGNEKQRNSYVDSLEKELVDNIHNKDYDINTALEKIPLSKDYMVQLFKRETGQTPLNYLIGKRISFAVQLLDSRKSNNMKVKEVAHMAGFKDPYYFSRIFKKITGKSPVNFILDGK